MTNIFALLFFVLNQLTVEQQLAEKYCPSKTNFKQPALLPTVWKVYNSNTTVGGGVCG